MLRSMTGFGRCETTINNRDIIVEVKSVNHRYFEFFCRATKGYSFLEEKLRSYINKQITRGKIDVFVSISSIEDMDVQIKVNHGLANAYIDALRHLKKTYDLTEELSISTISKYSDIFNVHKSPEDELKILSDVLTAVDIALRSCILMREAEGYKLKCDIEQRCNKIISIVDKVERRSPNMLEDYENRLKEKINNMLKGANYDEQRILTEVAIFSDKVSVTEEIVRLRSHFEQFINVINSDGPVGRKLDFIVQEMNREANTIGAKIQDAELSHDVVNIKSEIEKIREQIQNIE